MIRGKLFTNVKKTYRSETLTPEETVLHNSFSKIKFKFLTLLVILKK